MYKHDYITKEMLILWKAINDTCYVFIITNLIDSDGNLYLTIDSLTETNKLITFK